MSGPQHPLEDTSPWTFPDCSHRRQSLADVMRDVLVDTDLTIHVDLWHQPFDAFAKGAPWWQWRTPCDCPDTSFGRRPHRWNCHLTPAWRAQVVEGFIEPTPWPELPAIPQLEVWRRNRAAFDAMVDLAIAHGIAICTEYIGWFIGVDNQNWAAVDDAQARAVQAAHDAHPLTLASEWGARTELDYYGGTE